MPVYGVWGWGVSNRSTFEKAFPVPAGIYWNEISEQYDGLPGSVGLDEIEAYQARFEGWQAAQAPASGEVEPVGDWLIQMRGDYLVTRGVWERPDHRGYTNDINEAGRYSEAEAKEAERMLPDKCKAVCLTRPAAPDMGGEK